MPPTVAQIDVLAQWLSVAAGTPSSKREPYIRQAQALLTDPPAVMVEAIRARVTQIKESQ
ncbi:hypothetical protein [Fimbriiglobus ruber]|uniref:Uncharacterized protein n=1 Tax=Fimbriiglobus ruber TaxID=1908690 RepID=A0A225CY39_9BACT|nr:hypothetical protein [Fimbriiglobus ruber]OWK34251.1 hypothetical protein FRUB_10222 [Fimbriiglobus ruber]